MQKSSEAMDTFLEESGPTAIGPLDDLIGYHLRRGYAVMSADFAETFAGTAMRQSLFGILSVISANPGINQGQVGKVLSIQRTNMVALVNELVDLGLVTRRLAQRDRRAFSLNLTEHGGDILIATLERIRLHEKRMLQRLTPIERATLDALLRKIQTDER
jgi:DNA-binding MarR family transcriptional regulator